MPSRNLDRHEPDHLGGSDLFAIARLSESLFEPMGLDALIEGALRTAIESVEAESGSILLADPATEQLVFRYSQGASPVPPGMSIPWNKGIAGAVFSSGKAERHRDVNTSPKHLTMIDQELGHRTRDVLSVPLKRWAGAPVGVINVLNKRRGTFSEADLSLLTVFGSLTAVAIEKAERIEEAKLAEVARTLGNVSHDLKNLLTPALSSADLLSEELGELFSRRDIGGMTELAGIRQRCLESIELIRRAGGRLHHRVKEIADCVKGRSSTPVFVPCEMASVAEEVLSALTPMAEEGGVKLETEGLESLPRIHGDEHRLYTALYNLVINAIPEVPRNGCVVVRGRHERGAPHVEIEVRDTGAGIAPAVRERLFTDTARSTKQGGTGLGTRIVRDVVEAHGGAIQVDSLLAVGTTVRFSLLLDPRTRVLR